MPQCQLHVFCFFGFRKVSKEIFKELDETKAEAPIFLDATQSPKERRSGATRWPHLGLARVHPRPRFPMVWAPRGSTDLDLSPIYTSPQDEIPSKIRNP